MSLSVLNPDISSNESAFLSSIDSSESASNLSVKYTAQTDIEVSGAVTLSTTDSETLETTLVVEGIDQLSHIEIAGQTYTAAVSASSIKAGQFVYDPFTRQLRVKPSESQQTLAQQDAVVAIAYGLAETRDASKIKPEFIATLSSLFIKWNVSGTIRLRRAFRQAASCAFEFKSFESQRSAILTDWKNGQTTWTIRDQGFRQTSISIRRLARSKSRRGEISVLIEGESVYLRPLSDDVSFVVPVNRPTRSTTLAALCNAAAVPYRGPEITVPVPDEITSRTRTTALEWAEQRDRSVAGYRYFSSVDAFEIRVWSNPREHTIALADIMSDPPAINYNGDGAIVDDIPLAAEWSNRTLEADEDSSDEANRNIIRIVYSAARETRPVSFTPERRNELRDLSLAWPNSPPAWEQWETTFNKQPIEIRRREYGWLFDAFDVYGTSAIAQATVVNGVPQSAQIFFWKNFYRGDASPLFNVNKYWRVCKEETTRFYYNRDGYRVRALTKGWEYARFLDEDLLALQREFAEAFGDTDERYRIARRILLSGYFKPRKTYLASAAAAASSSQIVWTPNLEKSFKRRIYRETTYTLDELRRWFPDVPAAADDEPEAKFVARVQIYESGRETYPDPDSTSNDQKSPLAVGKEFDNTRRLTFVRPAYIGDKTSSDFERYKEIETIRSSEGPGFKKEARQESVSYSDGRPSVQERRIIFDEDDSPLPDTLADEEQLALETLVSTPDQSLTSDDPSDGTIRFDGIRDESEMIALATVEAQIENTESSAPAVVSILPARYDIHEGDRVFVEGQAWRVFEIDESFDIVKSLGGDRVLCSASQGWTLTIGREFAFDLDVLRRQAER